METSSLQTLKIMPRNLNKIVRPWIRLLVFPVSSSSIRICLSRGFRQHPKAPHVPIKYAYAQIMEVHADVGTLPGKYSKFFYMEWSECAGRTRGAREGWPLQSVETEVNGDYKSTNERGSFLGWFVGHFLAVQEIFILPWLLRSAHAVLNIFLLTVHYFNWCVPIAQQPAQAVVQGLLSLNVCPR